jgi:hypothetical protein
MDAAEARTAADAIKRGMNNLRAQLLVFYEREGWRALGYESWRACVETEFGQSQRHLYRQLEAAQIEQRIIEGEDLTHGSKIEVVEIKEGGEKSPMGDSENPAEEEEDSPPLPTIGTIPERQLRPLAALPAEDQAAAFALAKETAPEGKLTAAHVEKTVAEVMDRKPRKAKAPVDPKQDALCHHCVDHRRAGSSIPGVKVPGAFGKCIREGGPCARPEAPEVSNRLYPGNGDDDDSPAQEAPEGGGLLPPSPSWSLAKRITFITQAIDTIKDSEPSAKEALAMIALHVWNRQHKRGEV